MYIYYGLSCTLVLSYVFVLQVNPAGPGVYVMIQGIDPTIVSQDDIEHIIDIPIVSYEPYELTNNILIQLANSVGARHTVDKLDGQNLLGNVVRANVLHSPIAQPCSPSRPPTAQPRSPGRQRPPIAQSPGRPLNAQSPGRPLNAQSPGHPLNAQSSGRPLIAQSPGRPLNAQSPGRPLNAQSPGRPLIAQSPGSLLYEHPLGQAPHGKYSSSHHRSHPAQSASISSPNQLQQTGSLPNQASYSVKVTHLSPSVTKDMLYEHFSQVGELAGLPSIHETAHDSDRRYAHVNFKNHSGALAAVSKLDNSILGHERWPIKVKLAQSSKQAWNSPLDKATDMKTLKVSNLPPGIQEEQLFEHFGQYGEIDTTSSCILSKNTEAPYAYVNYFSSNDAANAASVKPQVIECLGVSRQISLQFQKSKLPTSVGGMSKSSSQQSHLSYRRTASSPVFGTNSTGSSQSPDLKSEDTPFELSVHVAEEDRPVDDVQSEHQTELRMPTFKPPSKYCSQNQASPDRECPVEGIQNIFPTDFNASKAEATDQITSVTVVFKVKGRTNKVDFKKYLDFNLKQEVQFEVIQSTRSQSDTEIEVQFRNVEEAVSSVQVLRICDTRLEAKLAKPQLDLVKLEESVTSFRLNIEHYKSYYSSKHLKLVDELRKEKQNVVIPKKCTVETYQEATDKRKVLQQTIEERERQQKEFELYCEQLQQKLGEPNISSELLRDGKTLAISRLRRNFGVECNRFSKALPIYAHRSMIVNTIQENKVCILIGETGSGKSTQLVQYLYDAGFSKEGIIVCTQPRKVAAVSLAKHVSMEMGETRVGEVLGYKTGMRGKFCDSTKVIYMTDHALLNECILDPTFTKYSCLVIDEAHERSLSTDILLAFIKRTLGHRSDLRVIITSATIDPDLFVRYFDGNCPVIRVPGRTFPVEVKWNPLQLTTSPIERDYVSDAVEVVCGVHVTEPPGDILVFLTSPPDIEKACQQTTDKLGNEALVLPLHGKLQPDEQQKIFSEDHDKRKIIFATNVAETSVTIPGVKYVVDTGLAKELCFDPKRNMNSLEVRIISKSSAEQRKGRAGRTSAGKCFRLYSEELYEGMPKKMLPEILRVALSSAVLKLYEFGISDILSFQFVESPDLLALEAAIDNLKFLGAIKDDKLTDLGRQMASLSMDPHLAKILFDGIKTGIGAEVVASVSISMLAGSVFFRAGTDEQKQESDIQKISFLHSGGDQMTCLQTYHEWSSQTRDHQKQWCVEKYVNAKSMRLIRESISEIRDILDKKFQIEIPATIDNLEQAEDKLPKLYFQTFIRNLCVFLGHERVGYLNSKLPDEQLVIFPGSSLRQMNEVPLYLVYEKTLKTSQHFMLQVLKVKEEWVHEAVATKELTNDPLQSAFYCHLRVSPLTFENLSNCVLNLILKEKEAIITELNSLEISPVFDTSQKKLGKLDVVVQSCYHESVSALLQERIASIREDLIKETLERGLNRDEDDVRVVVGNGGRVLRLLMPHEYRKVVVKGPREGEWEDEVSMKLQNCGKVLNQVPKEMRNERWLFVEFQAPESANMAVTSLECPENVCVEPQNRITHGRGELLSFSLQVEWSRRDRTSCAFLNFTNEEDKIIALAQLGGPISIAGDFIKVKPSTKNERQLFLPKVALHLTEEDLKECVLMYIPQVQRENVNVTLGREKSFRTTPEVYKALKEELDNHVLQCATKGTYTLKLLEPKDFHHVYRAYITFKNPEEGQRSVQSLVNKTVGGIPLSVKPNLSSIVRYQPDVYKVIKESVETAIREIKDRFSEAVEIADDKVDKRGNVQIKITSSDVPAFIAAKHALSTVINPEVIDCHTPELQGFIHTANIKTVLSRIEKETNTVIRIDYRTVNIKMYGTQANLTRAKIQFNASLSVFSDGTKCYEIQLKKSGMPPGVMKYLVSQYGHGLQGLEGRDGVKSASLNPQRQILTIFGTSGAHHSILKLVEEYSKTVNANPHAVQLNPDEIECCVCFTATSNHLSIIRLESCGHAYCLECITLQVSPSTLVVPVECAECSMPFVLKDFKKLCQRNVFKIPDLILVSVRSYVASNPQIVHVCPTLDCDMVYNISKDGQSYFCSQCGVTTCTKCHEPFHDGLSCEMYQAGMKGDKELEEWLTQDPESRKRCPKCSVPIEKIAGCNHMYCTSCKVHICWFSECLKYFDTATGKCLTSIVTCLHFDSHE